MNTTAHLFGGPADGVVCIVTGPVDALYIPLDENGERTEDMLTAEFNPAEESGRVAIYNRIGQALDQQSEYGYQFTPDA